MNVQISGARVTVGFRPFMPLVPGASESVLSSHRSQTAIQRGASVGSRFSQAKVTIGISSGSVSLLKSARTQSTLPRSARIGSRVSKASVLIGFSPAEISTLRSIRQETVIRKDATPAPSRISRMTATLGLDITTPEEENEIVFPDLPDADHFVHVNNWAVRVQIGNTYRTTPAKSPFTGRRENVIGADRPTRTIEFTWTFDPLRPLAIQQMLDQLKTSADEMSWFILYSDVVTLIPGEVGGENILWSSEDVQASDASILHSQFGGGSEFVGTPGKVHCRRLYKNTTVALFRVDCGVVQEVIFQRLQFFNGQTGEFLLQDPTVLENVDTSGRWFMAPMVYCEILSKTDIEHHNPRTNSVSILAQEQLGPHSIPASIGADESVPFRFIDPNKELAVTSSIRREMDTRESGRSEVFEALEERHRLEQSWTSTVDREGFCNILNLFDAARGRGYPFVLPEFIVTVDCLGVLNDKVFVKPFDTENFTSEGFDQWKTWIEEAGWICICISNGDKLFGKVSLVLNELTSWSVTVEQSFDTAILAKDALLFLPARRTFFSQDTMTETWFSPCGCEVSFSTEEDLDPVEG